MKLRRWTFLEVCVVVGIVGVLVGLLFSTIDHDTRHRYPLTVPSLLGSDPAVAGEFYQGAPRGRYFRLSILADGRYSFVWSGCTGVHHRESGFVEKDADEYVLLPAVPAKARIDRRFRLVRWQTRRYLIPPEQLADFVEAVIRGEEPRYRHPGGFYVDDPLVPVEGLPELPADAARELQRRLALGRITARSDGSWKVNLGTDHGIARGDLLLARPREHSLPRTLQVVTLEKASCTARESNPGAQEKPLAPGQEILAEKFPEPDEPR